MYTYVHPLYTLYTPSYTPNAPSKHPVYTLYTPLQVNMDHFRVAFGNEHSAVEFPIGKKVDFTQNRHKSKVIVHDNSPQSYK